MVKASIDIGSNTVLLLVGEVSKKDVKTLRSEQRVTSLGKGIDSSGMLCENSMKDTEQAIEDYLKIIEDEFRLEYKDIVITATEAARVAKNGADFLHGLQKNFGVKIHIISGEQEAYYTALGTVTSDFGFSEFVIVDIGGASTEFIHVKRDPFEVVFSISLPLGAVRASEWLENNILNEKVDNLLDQELLDRFKGLPVVAVAGSYTSLAAMSMGLAEFSVDLVHNSTLTYNSLESLVDRISNMSILDLMESYPHLGKRAKAIKAGSKIALSIGKRLEISEYLISCRGLRYGTILMDID